MWGTVIYKRSHRDAKIFLSTSILSAIVMKVLLIGSPIFIKIRQKLEYHLPQLGHTTVSSEYLENCRDLGDEETYNKEFGGIEACIVFTNVSGFLDELSLEYIDFMKTRDIPTVSLHVLKDEGYKDIPVEQLENILTGELNLAQHSKQKPAVKKKKTSKKPVDKAVEEKAASMAEALFEEKLTAKTTETIKPEDIGTVEELGLAEEAEVKEEASEEKER